MSVPASSHYAPSLDSQLKGLSDETGNLSFRGVPYADVDKRWTHSTIKYSLTSPFDATQFGPRCVQADAPPPLEEDNETKAPIDHEFKCLNLNICVPDEAYLKEGAEKLPVLVWIHGGSFCFGSNSIPASQPERLSQVAKEAGSPVVVVSINSRLSSLGFARSEDLELERSSERPDSVSGNYGLIDQRNAFQWIQDHIADFGGDKSNVTACGCSSGSASIHMHIIGGSPLFDKAVLMSGLGPGLGPLSAKYFQREWNNQCAAFCAEGDTPTQKIEKLRAQKPYDIVSKAGRSPKGPFGDGVFLPESWDPFVPQPTTRCKTIMIGDVRVDGNVTDIISQMLPQEYFHHLVNSVYASSQTAEEFREIFGFSQPGEEMSKDTYKDLLRKLFSTACFHYHSLIVAESFSKRADPGAGKVYLYHFDQPNPFDGIPTHGQCAQYLFQPTEDHFTDDDRKIFKEMGENWTTFAHGKDPWEPYSTPEGGIRSDVAKAPFKRFGPGPILMSSVANDDVRSYEYLPWLRKNFKETNELTTRLYQGWWR